VDNTRVCKAIHAALVGASGCAFTATVPGLSKVLDWREMVDETLAAAAAQGSGKYAAYVRAARKPLQLCAANSN